MEMTDTGGVWGLFPFQDFCECDKYPTGILYVILPKNAQKEHYEQSIPGRGI